MIVRMSKILMKYNSKLKLYLEKFIRRTDTLGLT